jgi:hypothetical protein
VIRRLVLVALLFLPISAHAQTVMVMYRNGEVRFAYPAGGDGNLYIMHPDGRTSNVYPLAGGAFSIVDPDGSISLAFPQGPDTLVVTRTGLRAEDLKRLGY